MVPSTKGFSSDQGHRSEQGLTLPRLTIPRVPSHSKQLYSWEFLVTAVVLAAVGGAALGFLGGGPIAGRIAEHDSTASLWKSDVYAGNPSVPDLRLSSNKTQSESTLVDGGIMDACSEDKRAQEAGRKVGSSEATWNPAVKVFYHVAALGESFEQIIIEHMTRLLMSGVYERAEGIYCFVMGTSQENITVAEDVLLGFGSKVRVVNTTLDVSLFERFTLESIRDHVEPSDVVLYFHTKGITKTGDMHVFYWTLYMHYFLLRRHERCIELLRTYDTVGCQQLTAPKTHYSGNFWWARASYFMKLEPKIGPDYYEPEMYLASGPEPAMYQIWAAANQLFYTYSYVPSMYVDQDIANSLRT